MKSSLPLAAVILALGFSTPALAEDGHKGDHHKGKMFEKHDTNGDGVVSKAEFLAVHTEKFDEIDADNSGDITKDEADAHFEVMKEKMKERWADRKAKREAAGDAAE